MKYDPKFLELNITTVFEFLHFMLGFGHEQFISTHFDRKTINK